ncbi:MAG TPA: hypothetical protein VEQ16_07680, partial [Acidocella sp.]|nr:hypothetical protein [Acidocella sp.]
MARRGQGSGYFAKLAGTPLAGPVLRPAAWPVMADAAPALEAFSPNFPTPAPRPLTMAPAGPLPHRETTLQGPPLPPEAATV